MLRTIKLASLADLKSLEVGQNIWWLS